jgi:hypothetical protein
VADGIDVVLAAANGAPRPDGAWPPPLTGLAARLGRGGVPTRPEEVLVGA